MQLYSQLQVLSTKLIKQFGVPCTVITSRNGDYDPSTGAMQTIKTEKSAYCLFDNLPMISLVFNLVVVGNHRLPWLNKVMS